MDLILNLASNLASMMLIVLTGFVIVRIGLLKQEESKTLSKLVVYIMQPCLILNSFQIELTEERLRGFLTALLFSTLVYIVWILLVKLLKKPLHMDGIIETTLVYSNVGNLCLPLIALVLGEEMVFYGSAIQIPFNLFLWTHGVSAIREEKKFNLRKLILNPNLIAIWAGLLLMVFRVQIPSIPLTAVRSTGGMVGPASLLVVGMVVANEDLRNVFIMKKAYLVLLGRLIVFPLLAMLLLWSSGFLRRSPEYIQILLVSFIALSAPPASTVSQLAVVYDKQPLEASIYNVMGIYFCIITMPLMIACYQFLFH